jgi:hypothetical protein
MNEPSNDVERMLRPDLWPNRPLLPMKKYDYSRPGAFPTFGIYHEDGRFIEGIGIWEAVANLELLRNKVARAMTPAQLIEEGWVID